MVLKGPFVTQAEGCDHLKSSILAHLLKFLYLKMAITDKLHDYLNGNQLFEVRTKTTRSRMSQLHVRQIATGSLVIRAYYLIYVEDLQLT